MYILVVYLSVGDNEPHARSLLLLLLCVRLLLLLLRVQGWGLSKGGARKLIKKFGIDPENLWLRAFNLKDRAPVIVYI